MGNLFTNKQNIKLNSKKLRFMIAVFAILVNRRKINDNNLHLVKSKKVIETKMDTIKTFKKQPNRIYYHVSTSSGIFTFSRIKRKVNPISEEFNFLFEIRAGHSDEQTEIENDSKLKDNIEDKSRKIVKGQVEKAAEEQLSWNKLAIQGLDTVGDLVQNNPGIVKIVHVAINPLNDPGIESVKLEETQFSSSKKPKSGKIKGDIKSRRSLVELTSPQSKSLATKKSKDNLFAEAFASLPSVGKPSSVSSALSSLLGDENNDVTLSPSVFADKIILNPFSRNSQPNGLTLDYPTLTSEGQDIQLKTKLRRAAPLIKSEILDNRVYAQDQLIKKYPSHIKDFLGHFHWVSQSDDVQLQARQYYDVLEHFLKVYKDDMIVIYDGKMQHQESAEIHLHKKTGLFISFEIRSDLDNIKSFITAYQVDNVDKIIEDHNIGMSHSYKETHNKKQAEKKAKKQEKLNNEKKHFEYLSPKAKISKKQIQQAKKLIQNQKLTPRLKFNKKEQKLVERYTLYQSEKKVINEKLNINNYNEEL